MPAVLAATCFCLIEFTLVNIYMNCKDWEMSQIIQQMCNQSFISIATNVLFCILSEKMLSESCTVGAYSGWSSDSGL